MHSCTLLLSLAVLAFTSTAEGAVSYQPADAAPLEFAAAEIERSANAAKQPAPDVAISIINGAAQSYRIERDGEKLRVIGGDAVGAMYGGLDSADAIRLGTLDALRATAVMDRVCDEINQMLSDMIPQTATKNEANLEFVHSRDKVPTDVTCTVEWSDSLLNDWSTSGVSAPTILSDNGVSQQIKVTVTAGSGVTKRFVHLKVIRP